MRLLEPGGRRHRKEMKMDTTELKKGLKIAGQVERVNGKVLSYSEFVERYLVKNHPVVLTGLMDDWRACKDWVTVNGGPNLSFFSIHFGKSEVQVADCGYREFTDQKRVEMSVSEFINHWLAQSAGNHSTVVTEKYDGKSLLYLKDWHFMKEYPEYVAYATPLFFCDDWLNLYLDKHRMHNEPDIQESNGISCSDYRFVYMGPKGTWTPLHADVFRSYSWSANVCGTKLWLFLPPPQCHLVFDRHMKSSVYNIFEEVDESKYPGFKKAVWMECTQGHNEVIFVPSGWYHQVLNLDDTISINHNWFNAYNLSWVWDLLRRDYEDAKDCIEDIRDISDDFEGLCQRNLAANTGMNFYDFFTFAVIMTFANSVHLYHLTEDCKSLSNSHPRINHIVLNLQSIWRICLQMESTCLGENHGILFDFKQTVCDPFFLELCAVLDKTYQKLHDPCSPSCCENGSVTLNGVEDSDFVKISGSLVSTPENLVGFLDCVLQKLDRIPCSKITSSCP